ncbi:hypothetical protein ACSQ67_015495 [Phaseolus vulgaris]
MGEEGVVSDSMALIACITMALFYVAILYAPTLLLRLPPPSSFETYMIRRFLCAIVSSVLSLFLSVFILPVQTKELHHIVGVFGIRRDHIWQAVVLPLCLTSLMYAGSIFDKCLLFLASWGQHTSSGDALSFDSCKFALQRFLDWLSVISSNILVWRNYVVAPLTEELVFRACMIPLLLCGGFKTYSVTLLCPIFFSLGLQLGYTVVFGSYASFLFIRTGHLVAPLVAHIYCNFMGLPVLYSQRSSFSSMKVEIDSDSSVDIIKVLDLISDSDTLRTGTLGIVSVTFIIGFLGFLWLLFPMTGPDLYNERIDNCSCWQGYCTWRERIRMPQM